jgi:excisionase family DNA binding protein
MRTLTLEEAAAFLHVHPNTLRQKAQDGEIPGSKPGKRWVFLDVDLADYLRSNYRRQASRDSSEGKEAEWLSIDKKARRSGGSTSLSLENEYAKALGLPTEGRLRSITTA